MLNCSDNQHLWYRADIHKQEIKKEDINMLVASFRESDIGDRMVRAVYRKLHRKNVGEHRLFFIFLFL